MSILDDVIAGCGFVREGDHLVARPFSRLTETERDLVLEDFDEDEADRPILLRDADTRGVPSDATARFEAASPQAGDAESYCAIVLLTGDVRDVAVFVVAESNNRLSSAGRSARAGESFAYEGMAVHDPFSDTEYNLDRVERRWPDVKGGRAGILLDPRVEYGEEYDAFRDRVMEIVAPPSVAARP